MSLHRRRVHPEYDPSCFGCRAGTLSFATAPTNDARSRAYNHQRDFAAEFSNGDREAYRRLRADGEQPPTIRGSAALEAAAETSFEITTGRVATDRRGLRTTLDICADAGFDPLAPSTRPLPEVG